MTKTFSMTITLAAAIIGLAAAAAPAQAATRLMTSSLEGFEYRCEHHGGAFSQDGNSVACQTPSVPVDCEFFTTTRADCRWPGIENQIDVIRVIGTLAGGDSGGQSSGNAVGNGGGGGKGGGLQGPNDIKDAPNNNPKPNFNGPNEFQMKP